MKLKYNELLSSFARNSNLRPYSTAHLYQVRSIAALRTYERAHDMHALAKAAFAKLEARMEGGRFDTELMIQCSDAGSTAGAYTRPLFGST